MESNILEAVKNDTSQPVVVEQKKRPVLKVIWSAALAAAASVALLFGAQYRLPPLLLSPHRQTTICRMVDQAFAQLSSADQAFLLDVYQEDVFLNN